MVSVHLAGPFSAWSVLASAAISVEVLSSANCMCRKIVMETHGLFLSNIYFHLKSLQEALLSNIFLLLTFISLVYSSLFHSVLHSADLFYSVQIL